MDPKGPDAAMRLHGLQTLERPNPVKILTLFCVDIVSGCLYTYKIRLVMELLRAPIFYKSIFGAQLWYIPSDEGLLLGEFSEVKLDKRS